MNKRAFHYQSGEEIRPGDRITYHGEPGRIQFVVTAKTGDAAMDWFLEEYPDGGVMLNAESFGDVFLPDTAEEEDLLFLRRANQSPA